MKKILSLLLVFTFVIILSGCGKDKVTTTVCNYTDGDGSKMAFDLSATNDEIDRVKMTVVPSNTLMGISSFKDLDDDTKNQIKDAFLAEYGLEKDTYEGLKIEIVFDDNMNITFDADLKVADEEILKKIGMDFEDSDMSLERAIEDMEAEGYTCK